MTAHHIRPSQQVTGTRQNQRPVDVKTIGAAFSFQLKFFSLDSRGRPRSILSCYCRARHYHQRASRVRRSNSSEPRITVFYECFQLLKIVFEFFSILTRDARRTGEKKKRAFNLLSIQKIPAPIVSTRGVGIQTEHFSLSSN